MPRRQEVDARDEDDAQKRVRRGEEDVQRGDRPDGDEQRVKCGVMRLCLRGEPVVRQVRRVDAVKTVEEILPELEI